MSPSAGDLIRKLKFSVLTIITLAPVLWDDGDIALRGLRLPTDSGRELVPEHSHRE